MATRTEVDHPTDGRAVDHPADGTAVERRTAGTGLLGLLERELAWLAGLRPAPDHAPGHLMRCEEYEEDGRLVVRAELPGVDPDADVEVTVADGVLRIAAHRREEHREHRRTEFFYGEMIRTLLLPPGADEKAVTATCGDGVLEVVVPLTAARAEPARVPVVRTD